MSRRWKVFLSVVSLAMVLSCPGLLIAVWVGTCQGHTPFSGNVSLGDGYELTSTYGQRFFIGAVEDGKGGLAETLIVGYAEGQVVTPAGDTLLQTHIGFYAGELEPHVNGDVVGFSFPLNAAFTSRTIPGQGIVYGRTSPQQVLELKTCLLTGKVGYRLVEVVPTVSPIPVNLKGEGVLHSRLSLFLPLIQLNLIL